MQQTFFSSTVLIAWNLTPQAINAIEELRHVVDTLIVIPNDKLLEAMDANVPVSGLLPNLKATCFTTRWPLFILETLQVTDAFLAADNILRQGVRGISDIITVSSWYTEELLLYGVGLNFHSSDCEIAT